MNHSSVLLIGIVIILLIAVPPSSAALINGTFYYRNITPQNNIYETVVYPRDTIVLGRTYDLTKVLGFSQEFAWWADPSNEGRTCTPDIITNVSYIKSQGTLRPDSVTLSSPPWRKGNWYQWDGCFQQKYQRNQEGPVYSVYMNDDNMMFTIINDPHPPAPAPVFYTQVPTPTPLPTPPSTTITPQPTPALAPVDDSWPWWYYLICLVVIFIVWRMW